MKKVLLLSVVAFLMLATSFKAQAIEDPNPKGTFVLGAQVGFLPGVGASLFGDYVLVDSWWKGHFTVGGELLYRHYGRWNYVLNGDKYRYSYNDFAIAGRATYGLNITPKFEVHAGVLTGVGFSRWGWNYEGQHSHDSYVGFCWGGLAGVRYFFTEGFGVTAEVQYTGYGPYTNVGVVFKF